jgi:uncharacterized protein
MSMQSVDLIKDIDIQGRRVIFAFAKFNVYDEHKDYTFPGAFAKTIVERGPQGKDVIKHLYNHNKTVLTPIGKLQRLWEDDEFAYAESILLKNQTANDVLDGYEKGTLKEHSYWGKGIITHPNSFGGKNLKEIKLNEVSTVLFPAQEEALLMKGDADGIAQVIERVDNLNEYLRKSNASDDFLETIELEVSRVSELLKSLRPQEIAPKPITERELVELYRLL